MGSNHDPNNAAWTLLEAAQALSKPNSGVLLSSRQDYYLV